MKTLNFFFTITVMITTVNFVNGQQPYKLVDDSNKWYEYGQFGGYYPYPAQHVHLTYFFNGDTVINSITYKKLFHDEIDTIYSSPPYIHDSYGYTAAFRQDSLKVYFIMADNSNENLYCDFNISIGDTLNYFYNNTSITVDSIDSIPYGSGFRKQYILANGFSFYEGIGNSLGLFHDFSIGIEGGIYLVCFQQDGITQNVYAFGGTPPACGLTNTSIKEKSVNSNNVAIFPNPFSEYSTITFNYNYNQKYSLTLYDTQGRLVRTIMNIMKGRVEIERKNLNSGLYFFQLCSDRQIPATGKLIIE